MNEMLQNEQEVRDDSSERSHDSKERDVQMTHTFAVILIGAEGENTHIWRSVAYCKHNTIAVMPSFLPK